MKLTNKLRTFFRWQSRSQHLRIIAQDPGVHKNVKTFASREEGIHILIEGTRWIQTMVPVGDASRTKVFIQSER